MFIWEQMHLITKRGLWRRSQASRANLKRKARHIARSAAETPLSQCVPNGIHAIDLEIIITLIRAI